MVKLKHKEAKNSTVTYGGEVYKVQNGIVEVPAAAVETMASFGYFPYVPEPKKEKEKDETTK